MKNGICMCVKEREREKMINNKENGEKCEQLETS